MAVSENCTHHGLRSARRTARNELRVTTDQKVGGRVLPGVPPLFLSALPPACVWLCPMAHLAGASD